VLERFVELAPRGASLGHGGAQRFGIEGFGAQRFARAALCLPVSCYGRLDVPLVRAELATQLLAVAGWERRREPLDARGGVPRPVPFPRIRAPRERRPRPDEEQVERERSEQNPAGPPAGRRRGRRARGHGCASGNGSGANTTAPMSLSATIEAVSSLFGPTVMGPRST